MITPIKSLNIWDLIKRENDLLVSVEDIKKVAENARREALMEMFKALSDEFVDLWDDASDSVKNRPSDRTDEAQCGYECIQASWTMAIQILNDIYEQLKEHKNG